MKSTDGHPTGGVLFDKDGTLLDFHLTWDEAIGSTLKRLAPDAAALDGAARAIGYDLLHERVEAGSPVIAESNATIMALLDPWLDTASFEDVLTEQGVERTRPVPGAGALIELLGSAAPVLGLVTNDSEATARRQLARLDWERMFTAVIGYDSGFGEKPDPGPVLAALGLMDVPPWAAVMVGDSVHDMDAARAAGVAAVYVGASRQIAGLADLAVADLTELVALWSRPG